MIPSGVSNDQSLHATHSLSTDCLSTNFVAVANKKKGIRCQISRGGALET